MTPTQYQKNQTIITEGQSLTHLYLIAKGSVKVSFPGGSYVLGKGDIIGICEVTSDIHLFQYTTLEDTVVAGYSCSGIDSLESLFQAQPDITGLFCLSAIKQINFLLNRYNTMVFEYSALYHSCKEDYGFYETLCRQHMISPRNLPLLEEFEPLADEQPIDNWVISYYDGIHHLLNTGGAKTLAKSCAVAVGLICKTALDAITFTEACRDLCEYRNAYLQLYLNEKEEDLFTLYTALYFKISAEHSDRDSLYSAIRRLILEIRSADYPSPEYAAKRIGDFTRKVEAQGPVDKNATASKSDSAETSAGFMDHLTGSLDTILTYSEISHETAVTFKEAVFAYRELADPFSTEGSASALRKKITDIFYTIYEAIFMKSLKDEELPIPVKLFLYFGYVDETLAGSQNLGPLYTLADSMEENLCPGVYTLYHWLLAVYNGEKEPSRNQYDEDYNDHVHSLRASKKVTDLQAKQLLTDQTKKVMYELKNMFPVVNKMTCGRISTYCPIFAEHQVMKSLTSCYVSSKAIMQALEQIRKLDFSAFYRETLYTNDSCGIPREFIHVEYLPDFILMPNIGSRGVMWQEIEGKKRTTPSRMMLSIFQLEDISNILVRLTGEYRWEMCKRIQGPRWNDIGERSLTSEYFDYVQFYRKNHELSVEAKEKVKNSLQKARNNFKEMFIMDYMTWILHEGGGSPRMNKIARQIIFTYCPFSTATRQTLASNPIYKELFDRYDIQLKKRIHHMEMVVQKVRNSGQKVPEEIENEQKYILL
ncbi:MAG: cyclic nucleotide-binding domain-containing protein [Lachnospiraceae bacterium]|nr:cyclic nucleotide-binding domain-containing protein [Lachnospiraceae bacterium]